MNQPQNQSQFKANPQSNSQNLTNKTLYKFSLNKSQDTYATIPTTILNSKQNDIKQNQAKKLK
jgi:hypothetical protein